MKKVMSLVMACAFILGVTMVFAGNVPEKLVIDAIKDKKAAVEFNHKAHADREGKCETCHHKFDGNGDPKACTSCHTGTDKKDSKSGYSVFHKGDRSCKGCHKNSGKETAPTKCTDCHPNK